MGKPPAWQVWRAQKAFEDFTGHKAKPIGQVPLDEGDFAGYRLGRVVGVAYEAKRDGKKDRYFHEFSRRAAPDLVSRFDGKRLYLVGGNYAVTDRGIEDRNMSEVFMVNPSSRRRRRRTRTSNGRFTKNPTRRPAARRRRSTRRRSAVQKIYVTNPARRTRRMRKNPSFRLGRGSLGLLSMLIPAAMVGAGAVGAELITGALPLPDNLKSGPLKYVAKAGVAIAGGYLIAKFANKRAGELIAMGGIAIAAHDAIRQIVSNMAPGLKFGQYVPGMGYWNAAMPVGSMAGQWAPYGYNDNTSFGQYTPPVAMGGFQPNFSFA